MAQIYADEAFLAEAVSHYAAEGVARGDAIVLVATAPRWTRICAGLQAKGFDPVELSRRGQLTVKKAEEVLPPLMQGDMPDEALFRSLAMEAIAKAGADGRYARVRWWSEVANTLLASGNVRASVRLEELIWDVAAEMATAVLCSYYMDKFDPRTYDGAFADLCRTHNHVIPAENYVHHRLAITRAIEEVIGRMQGTQLRSLMAWQACACEMPSSQSLLLWVRETMPDRFDTVLARTKECEKELEIAASAN